MTDDIRTQHNCPNSSCTSQTNERVMKTFLAFTPVLYNLQKRKDLFNKTQNFSVQFFHLQTSSRHVTYLLLLNVFGWYSTYLPCYTHLRFTYLHKPKVIELKEEVIRSFRCISITWYYLTVFVEVELWNEISRLCYFL